MHRLGLTRIFPVPEASPAAGAERPGRMGHVSVNASTPACTGGQLYTVRPGDTLPSIGSAFGISLESLVTANPQLITAGLVLCVPVSTAACCLVLTPPGGGPAGASGIALVSPSASLGGTTLLVGAINLPPPATFGAFDTYFTRFIPPQGPSLSFALGMTTSAPQAVYAGGTAGVTASLPATTTVLVFPGTAVGAVGPVVLQGTLANCR